MSPETSDQPTQLGNYDVLAKIAEGGMGTVYKARSRVSGETVAIKVISPGTARNPVTLQRFEREFLAARVLDHPNVVKAIEYSGTGPHPFLVMEFVDGESLGQRVERAGPVPEAEAVRLIAQVCDGLQRAHKQGLVHRDVKPDNILVTLSGVAKLTDMGLVKDVEGDINLTKTGRGLGTPHYMAPEQFRNAKGVDVRGDIYSLGATLYAMVTGTMPFENTNPLDCWMKKIRNEFAPPKELNPAVSDRIDWAIRRAMSAEPAQRPASCREFVEDLTGQSRPGPADPARSTPTGADLWYLVYRDENGQPHTVKGATANIRNALRDGLLGDAGAILVGRSKTGQFQPIGSVPEFRDLVVSPAPVAMPGRGGLPGVHSGAALTPAPGPGTPADAIDLGAMPTGSDRSGNLGGRSGGLGGRSGPMSGPMSGRTTPAPVSGRYTPRPQTGRMTPPPGTPRPPTQPSRVLSPSAETEDFTTNPLAGSAPSASHRPLARGGSRRAKPSSFDWTPVLLLLIAILSGLLAYFGFMR